MLLEGALLWMLALNPLSLLAQETIREGEAPAEPALPNGSAGASPSRKGGDQPNPTPKIVSDGQFGEKSKDEEPLPAYKLLRYEEDYSYLKDPSRRTDFWDAIKYVPVSHREDWYMSFGGFLRERFEILHNGDAGAAPANAHGNNADLLERYLLHGDLHFGPNFRFFGQLVTGLYV